MLKDKSLVKDMAIATLSKDNKDNSRYRLTSERRVLPKSVENLVSKHVLWVQVNHWDLVYGPKVIQVWCTSDKRWEDDVFAYIARQTLQGNCASNFEDMPPIVKTEVHICPEFDISVVSATLNVVKTSDRYSLSAAISYEENRRFLTTIDAIQDEMSILGHEVHAVFESQKDSRKKAKGREARRWTLVTSLLQQFVHRFDLMFESRISCRAKLESTWFGYELDEEQISNLSMVITSHLQMSGRTVVVGPDMEVIDLYIYTLCLFSDEGQRALSRTAVLASPENLVKQYVRQFYIQGIMTSKYDPNAMRNLQEEFLLAPGPTSLVNLFSVEIPVKEKVKSERTRSINNGLVSYESTSSKERGQVIETPNGLDFIKQTDIRGDVQRLKIIRRRARSAKRRLTMSTSSSSLSSRSDELAERISYKPKVMKVDSPYIRDLVTDSFSLPTPLVLTYISAHYGILLHRAAELVFYIEEEKGDLLEWNDRVAHCSEGTFPSGKGIPRHKMYPDVLKKFREQAMAELEISNEEDFSVFLSLAEYYRPNLYVTLYGNPIFKQQMKELLSLFV